MIYTETQIYRDTYGLLLRVHRAMPHIPRELRYTIVRSLNGSLLQIERLVFRACSAYGDEKARHIAEMRQCLVDVEILLRLLSDLRGISEGLYTELCAPVASLSRQMSLWEKRAGGASAGGEKG